MSTHVILYTAGSEALSLSTSLLRKMVVPTWREIILHCKKYFEDEIAMMMKVETFE